MMKPARPGQLFRAVPIAIPEVEFNVSFGNMDFDDFAGDLDHTGVLRHARWFPQHDPSA
jgi:hypothetical protein